MLGIISVLCLGPIAGVVAIVLGVLGMKKATEIGNGKGMAIAGLILGIIGSLIWILGFILLAVGTNEAADRFDDAFGSADPDDYEIVVAEGGCAIDADGYITFAGTIENTAGRDMNFEIEAEIRNSRSNDVIAEPYTFVTIEKGDTIDWELTDFVSNPVDITCKVSSVDNWAN